MVKHSDFSLKLGLLLTGLLLVGVIMVVFLSAWKMRIILIEQEKEIYSVVLKDMVVKVQEEFNKNAEIDKNNRVNKIIDNYFNQLAPIKRISIFDKEGLILFDTNRIFVGSVVPEYWFKKTVEEGDRLWRADFQMLRGVDAPILNSKGEVIAYIVLLSQDMRSTSFGFKFMMGLSIVSLFVLTIVLGLCLLLVLVVARKTQGVMQPVLNDLHSLAYEPESLTPIDPKAPHLSSADASAFTRPVTAFLQEVGTAQKNLQTMVDAP